MKTILSKLQLIDIKMSIESIEGSRDVFADIKSGNNMSKQPMGGTIGQLTYQSDTQVFLPNSFCDLKTFNYDRKKELLIYKSQMSKEAVPYKQQNTYQNYLEEIIPLIDSMQDNNILENHIKIENILIKIHSLPYINRRPSYITIVELNEESSLSQIEQHFLDHVSQLAHDNMFKNQRQINKFIQVAFKIYCSDIDNMAYKKIITLKDTPWNPSFLDLIDTTLFS